MLNKSLPSHPVEGVSSIHRSASESVANPHTMPVKTGPFSHLLRRKKTNVEDAIPPPTPPKDMPAFATQASPPNVPPHIRGDSSELPYYSYHSPKNSTDYHQGHNYTQGLSRPRRSSVVSDVVHITHDESDIVVIEPQRPPTMLETKWGAEPFLITDPAERARRRSEARRHHEEQERKAVQEEEERQRKLKLQKQAIMEQEKEDEFLRKVQLDKELRDATTERLRRERAIKEEEDARALEAAEKKRVDKERRSEDARKREEWRAEEQKRSRELLRRQEEEIQRKERERKARVKVIEAKIRKSGATEMMTGWVTVQASDALTLTWKRRYFKFVGSKMSLYRTAKVQIFFTCLCAIIDDK